MDYDDLLTISETAERSGFSASALRYYESEGLIQATRTAGGQRRFERLELRRLAFIAAARHLGVPLEEIKATLDLLPTGRHPTKADWSKISRSWRHRLDDEIRALESLRDGLESCIGCGCLSLQRCRLSNPNDVVATRGPGAVFLPKALHPAGD